jgi:WD40 repeat protein
MDQHTSWVVTLVFTADAKRLISCGLDGKVVVWDVALVKPLTTLRGERPLALSPDETLIAFQNESGGRIDLFDIARGARTGYLEGHTDTVTALQFTPDGRQLLSASMDHTARVWDLKTGVALRTLNAHADAVTALAISRDGSVISTGSVDGSIALYDGQSGVQFGEMRGLARGVQVLGFSPGGRILASAGGDTAVTLWEVQTLRKLALLENPMLVYSLAFAPDGATMAVGLADGSVHFWAASAGRDIGSVAGHKGCVSAVAFSADGRLLATGGADGLVRVWQRQ